jgi:spore maturation protein CgeB
MKILIVYSDYPEFLKWFYDQNPGLAELPYDSQMRARNESLFGVADFYSRNLRKHGHEAWDVYANNHIMQDAWAREHGVRPRSNGLLKSVVELARATPLRYLKPVLKPLLRFREAHEVLAAQIRYHHPDVLLNQAMDSISDDFLWEMRPHVGFMVGQIASPLAETTFRSYDLVISSLPNFVDYFRKQGKRSELHRLAFETSILPQLQDRPRTTDISFIGSITSYHAARTRLLESICNEVGLSWWGHGADTLPRGSVILRHHRGFAWGVEMYQRLRDSRITLNRHGEVVARFGQGGVGVIDVAKNAANNVRLFEATGVGTFLLTDRKDNLSDMFEPGKEVAVYASADECVETIRYYLDHESEREAIARAGQERTLRDHNYDVRMQELGEILNRYVTA